MLRPLLLILFLLSGCASTPVQTHRSAEADEAFSFNGRVAVKQGAQHDKVGVRWVHNSAGDEILLLAPLGQTVARIRRDDTRVTLEASGRRYVASDMESLMQQALGWQLPLSGMRYWVVGLPTPDDEPAMEMDGNGQVSVMRQQGWEISYTKYASDQIDALPLRMLMKRERMEVLLVIDEWEAQQP